MVQLILCTMRQKCIRIIHRHGSNQRTNIALKDRTRKVLILGNVTEFVSFVPSVSLDGAIESLERMEDWRNPKERQNKQINIIICS